MKVSAFNKVEEFMKHVRSGSFERHVGHIILKTKVRDRITWKMGLLCSRLPL